MILGTTICRHCIVEYKNSISDTQVKGIAIDEAQKTAVFYILSYISINTRINQTSEFTVFDQESIDWKSALWWRGLK